MEDDAATIKITNAIKRIQSRNMEPEKNSSTFTTLDGHQFKTKERIVKEIPPVETKRPSDEQLFSNEDNKPNWRFMIDHFKKEGHLTESQLIKILNGAYQLMSDEPNLLQVGVPTIVTGDLHGQLFDLFQLFECSGAPDTKLDTNFLFLGDYVDRGDRSIEVLVLIYALKINYPNRVFLLRGNHECKRMTEYFTFKRECEKRYSLDLFDAAVESFKSLPLAAILNEQFFCVHAGISSELIHLDQINQINRFVVNTPSGGLFCDLLWSDPEPEYDTRESKGGLLSDMYSFNKDRRCSEFFSYQAVVDFLDRNDLLCVIRGHQPQDKGYRMYKSNPETHFPTLITLFSAPNYCHTYQNKAATLVYDGELFNVKQFDTNPSTPYYLPDFMNAFEWSLPFAAEKVLDIFTAVLNITTQEELEVSLPLDSIKTALAANSYTSKEEKDSSSSKAIDETLENRIRAKILVMGRLSRIFGVLRNEVERFDQLKQFGDSALPKETLINGRDQLQNLLNGFKEARDLDLTNEGLPPEPSNKDEVSDLNKT